MCFEKIGNDYYLKLASTPQGDKLGDGCQFIEREGGLMKRKIVALAVSLAVLFGTVVQTEAGTMDVRDGDAAGKVGTDIAGGKIHLNAAKKASGKFVVASMDSDYIGAITEDGSLYMWGANYFGMLGDGTNEDRNSPVKVLENVKSACLGGSCTGAITEDGSLSKKAPQKITYHSKSIKKGKVAYGTSFSLNAKSTGAGKLTYKSSDKKILSVNSKGKVTVKGYGPATIKIRASAGNGYKASVRNLKLIAVPGRGQVTKAVQENGVVRFKWKAEKTADGYEYATAYNKKFSGQSKKKTKKTGLALTKYKTGTKKMFIKVRTYKKAGKKTYYGSWSKARLLKLKKVRKTGESSYAIAN